MPDATHSIPSRQASRGLAIAATALCCLIAVDLVVRANHAHLAAYTFDPYQRKLDGLAGQSPPPEIVLMGSSRAKYDLDPAVFGRLTGRRAFNVGLAAAKVIEWQCIAEDHLSAIRPQLVVLGVNAASFRADYLPIPAARSLFTWQDLAEYTLSDGWSGEVIGDFLVRRSGHAWRTFHRREEIRFYLQEHLGRVLPKHAQLAREQRERGASHCPPDGFEHPWLSDEPRETLQSKLDTHARVWLPGKPDYAANARTFAHFARLLDWFHAHDIPLVVAYLPNSPRTEARWRDVEPLITNRIAALCDDHNVPFIPCGAADMARTNGDFLDEEHFALPLARRISERIAATSLAMGLLPPDDSRLARTSDDGGPQP